MIDEKAEGNPLFLEELARDVGDQADGSPKLSMPDTVQGVLQARINRLPDAPKRVLQTASVIGREVPLKVLRAVWETPASLDVHLLELKRLEFLHEKSAERDRIYVFKHALTQDVAHDSLLTPVKQVLHETTARALESIYQDRLEEYYERLAHHYCLTANRDKALEYLELANQKAVKSNAMQEALTYFEQAMAFLDAMPETETNRRRRISLIVNQWIVFWLLLRAPEYYDLLIRHEGMATALGEPQLLAHFQLNLGHCQWAYGFSDQAADTLISAARLYEAAGSGAEAGPAYCMLQWTHLMLGNLEQALSWQEPALRCMRERLDLRWYAWSFAAASFTYAWLGRCDEAVNQAQKELTIAEEYHDNSLVSYAHGNMCWANTVKGDFVKAIEHAEISLAKAPTLADKLYTQTYLGWALCRAGRAREGADLLASLVPIHDASQFVGGQVYSRTFLGEAYWRAGQLSDAEQTLQKGLELSTRAGMKFHTGFAHRLLGEINLERNPEQVTEPFAAPQFEQSIAILGAVKAEPELALAYVGYGHLHKRQGRMSDARDCFSRALEIFERLEILNEPDKVRTELAQLTGSA